jgi:hypothetical protein
MESEGCNGIKKIGFGEADLRIYSIQLQAGNSYIIG